MKILLLDDNEEKIDRQRDECKETYKDVEIVSIIVNAETQPSSLIEAAGNISGYNYVFADVNMPTAKKTLSLLCELRKNGLLSPIVLISADKNNRIIPTNILGKNARQRNDLFRRRILPSEKELLEMEAFSSKEEIPSCETDKYNLIALSILCQGYLAAHGGEGLKGWEKISEDLKKKAFSKASETEKPSWWKIITKSDDIDKEIESIEAKDSEEKKAKGEIVSLVTYLKAETLEKAKLSSLVKQAYNALCILEAGRFL